jgi:hypothetical protein
MVCNFQYIVLNYKFFSKYIRLFTVFCSVQIMYTTLKTKVSGFPVPSRDVITKLFLAVIPRESDIPAGDGKIDILFLQCLFAGYIMFYVRTPRETGDEMIGSALSLLWMVVHSVQAPGPVLSSHVWRSKSRRWLI